MEEMEKAVFNMPYYKVVKTFTRLIGQWPLDSQRRNVLLFLLVFLINGTHVIIKLIGLSETWRDSNILFESMGPLAVDSMVAYKYFNGFLHKKDLQHLLRKIVEHRITFEQTGELKVLNIYARRAQFFNTLYRGCESTVTITFLVFFFTTMLISSRHTHERPLLHNVEYFVDPQKYYCPIIIHSSLVICLTVFSAISMDSLFVVFVNHTCGLFAVLGYRLKHVSELNTCDIDLEPSAEDDLAYKNMLKCVTLHNEVLAYVDRLEETYSMSLFFLTGIHVLSLSFTGIQAMNSLGNFYDFTRQMMFAGGQIFHLIVECHQAQLIIDGSERLRLDIMNTNWYETSFKTRKLYIFMTLKVQKPIALTAGKLYSLSLETVVVVFKTAMSYFTVFRTV